MPFRERSYRTVSREYCKLWNIATQSSSTATAHPPDTPSVSVLINEKRASPAGSGGVRSRRAIIPSWQSARIHELRKAAQGKAMKSTPPKRRKAARLAANPHPVPNTAVTRHEQHVGKQAASSAPKDGMEDSMGMPDPKPCALDDAVAPLDRAHSVTTQSTIHPSSRHSTLGWLRLPRLRVQPVTVDCRSGETLRPIARVSRRRGSPIRYYVCHARLHARHVKGITKRGCCIDWRAAPGPCLDRDVRGKGIVSAAMRRIGVLDKTHARGIRTIQSMQPAP